MKLTAAARRTHQLAMAYPRRALAIGLVVVLAAAGAATQLGVPAVARLITDTHSSTAQATDRLERDFGGEPITVVLRGNLQQTLTPGTLLPVLGLEGHLAKLPGVKSVIGPGTFINETVIQTDQVITNTLGPAAQQAQVAANAAAQIAQRNHLSAAETSELENAARLRSLGPKLEQEYENILVRFGYLGPPSLLNATFIQQLVWGPNVQPKQRFRWLFPNNRYALILIRPRAGLSDSATAKLGRLIREKVRAAKLPGVRTAVAGEPLLVAAVAGAVRSDLLRLAPAVLAAMILALLIGFRRGRARLRPLLLAVSAVAVTEGLAWILGLGLTPATVAALPIVLGLALDFAVQLQARFLAERVRGRPPRLAATAAARALAPVLSLAAGAMALGFLVLVISGVPLVSGLGETLAVGIGASLLVVLLLGPPLLVLGKAEGGRPPRLSLPRWRGGVRIAWIAFAVAGGVALGGMWISHRATVQSDVTKLAPPGLAELRSVEKVQHQIGTGGELRIDVHGANVTTPAAVTWMYNVGQRVQALDSRLLPGPNLGQLLGANQGLPNAAGIRELERLLPPVFLDEVLSPDHHDAQLSFSVPLESVSAEQRLISRIEPLLAGAPRGLHAYSAGVIAEAAAGVDALRGDRPWSLLIAAALAFCVLLIARWRPLRALVPLVPVMMVAGVSSVVFVAAHLALSPLSASVEPLVLAVGVEFGLLLDARYREERRRGRSPAQACRAAREHVGAPVAISAGTVALGFAALLASRLPMLRQFGLLVAAEVILSALASVVLVPGLLAAMDRDAPSPSRPVRRRHAARARELEVHS
ncbi:MAG TPA: MMPL family transporter [Solirubrobacteraceae bacterium]|jgi:predicted RND superfamily exporter protein|nr:MMPL family transporter [Solirubrobacteraceae bacterium]